MMAQLHRATTYQSVFFPWLPLFYFLLVFTGPAHASESQNCPLADRPLSLKQLKDVLKDLPKPSITSRNPENSRGNVTLCRANLSEMNLAGMDLSGLDIHGAILGKANLNGANLRGSNLSGAKLGGATLSGADLDGANLSDAVLGGAKLNGANLGGATLTTADLFLEDLRGANLAGVIMRNARLSNADLIGAKLPNADLSQSRMPGTNLNGAALQEAKLIGAYLIEADLSGADLSKADLSGATLHRATLDGAHLALANLSGAHLYKAKLRGANLAFANLTGANLAGSNLSSAIFVGTHLKGTVLASATLANAVFEPGTNPEPTAMVAARDLSSMTYRSNRHGLATLRQDLRNAGLRQEGREVTYALKHSDRVLNWQKKDLGANFQSIVDLVLFECLSGYGKYPFLPLLWLCVLILLFSIPYALAVTYGNGIKVTWPEVLHDADPLAVPGQAVDATADLFFHRRQSKSQGRWSNRIVRFLAVFSVGLWFSFLMSFRYWREPNLATFLSRLQPREYTLVGTGRVRRLSVLQSLISACLFTLWPYTYLGPPLE